MKRFVVVGSVEVSLVIMAENYFDAVKRSPANVYAQSVRLETDPDTAEHRMAVLDDCVFCGGPIMDSHDGSNYNGVGVPLGMVPADAFPFSDRHSCCIPCAEIKGLRPQQDNRTMQDDS